MKTVATLLIVAIFLPFTLFVSMQGCREEAPAGCMNPEGGPMAGMKLHDGLSYHCPLCALTLQTTSSEPFSLPLIGQLFLPTPLPAVEDLTHLIFRPPESGIRTSSLKAIAKLHPVGREIFAQELEIDRFTQMS